MNRRPSIYALTLAAGAILLCFVGAPVLASVVTDGLVLYYRADNVDGQGNPGWGTVDTWMNLATTGWRFDGQLVGFNWGSNSGWVENVDQPVDSPYRHAIRLDGVDDHVVVARCLGLDENDFSYEFWMRPRDVSSRRALIGEYSTARGGNTKNFLRILGESEHPGPLSRDSYPIQGNAHTTGDNFVRVGEYIHVVMTKSGDTVTFYRNGGQGTGNVVTVSSHDPYEDEGSLVAVPPDLSWIGARSQNGLPVWPYYGELSVNARN